MSNYITDCTNGKAQPLDIYYYISQWDESSSNLPPHEYLGITEAEYIAFASKEGSIKETVLKYTTMKNYVGEVEAQLNKAFKAEGQPYYNQYPIEVIDMMIALFGKEKTADFCLLNAFKYRMRVGRKDDTAHDLAKEEWYLKKYKELTINNQ
jgi:hypothetical protein